MNGNTNQLWNSRRGWCFSPTAQSKVFRLVLLKFYTFIYRMPAFITEYPQFFTATNLEWKKLLEPDKYKGIIISSFRFLVEDKRIKLYAFVIMPNHIHLIWQMQSLMHPTHVQRDFMKYTAQKIKHDLKQHHPAVLELFRVDAADREYQLWERNPVSIELR